MIEVRGNVEGEEFADGVVVGVREGLGYDDVGRRLDDDLSWLAAHLDTAEFEGKAGQSVVVPGGDTPYRLIALVGLGSDPGDEEVRRAAAIGSRALRRLETVATNLHEAGAPRAAEAAALGFALGSYTFSGHKSEPKPSALETVVFLGAEEPALAAAARGLLVARAVARARDMVNLPARDKPPSAIADEAVAAASSLGVDVEVLGEDEIIAEGLGGLHGVSWGSGTPPRLVSMAYDPPGAKGFLAFVGKGIVFDSGGHTLKPGESMEGMKTDMAGAAAVIAATLAIAELEIPVKILTIAPLTENMLSGTAVRPGDVLRARNGKTIEVLNTDAEGRLVLADGLSLAAEAEPDMIVDLATLTGTAKAALGERIAALFGTDDAVEAVAESAEAAGEELWHMPLPRELRKNLDSEVADIKNKGPRWGGAIYGALFLADFVGDLPWAHVDMAGPGRSSDVEHYLAKGGTGFGVRTLIELADRHARR